MAHIIITDVGEDQEIKDALREIVRKRLEQGQSHEELAHFLHGAVEEEMLAATATPRTASKAEAAEQQEDLFAPTA